MTNYSYGNKQYIAVEGMDKAFALAKAIMQARDCQVMIQLDDCDIYIVSWANRYSEFEGEQFTFMDADQLEDWEEFLSSKSTADRDDQ